MHRNKKFIGFWLFVCKYKAYNVLENGHARMVVSQCTHSRCPAFTAPIAIINGYWIQIWYKYNIKCLLFFWSTYFYLWFIFCFCLSFIFNLATFKYIILAVLPFSPVNLYVFLLHVSCHHHFCTYHHILLSTMVSFYGRHTIT